MISAELTNSIANLRHLYANMQHGLKDPNNTRQLAEGLLAPVIEKLEKINDQLAKENI